MGSYFSSHIDRSHCVEKGLFEPWPMVAVVAAACRTMEIAKQEAMKSPNYQATRKPWESPTKTPSIHLRDIEIQRVQFHDTFVDFSYILPLLSKSVDKAMEFREKEIAAEAAERGEEVPEDDEQELAAKARERNERIHALTGAFKGLKDEIFDLFVANPIVPKQVGGKLLDYGSKEGKEGKEGGAKGSGAASDSKEGGSGGAGNHKEDDDSSPESLNTMRIRAIEVLTVLTVMCKSTPMQKLSMLYCLFSDGFDWSKVDRAMDQTWLYAKNALDCADSIRCSIRGQQLHDLLLTVGVSMRRVGMSVADVPFHAVDLESAAVSLPKAATLPLIKRNTRGIRRFKAVADVIRHAIRAGIVEGVLNTAKNLAAAQAAEEGATQAYEDGTLMPSTGHHEGGEGGEGAGEESGGAGEGIIVAGSARSSATAGTDESSPSGRNSLSLEGLGARLSKSSRGGGGFATLVEAAMAVAAKDKLSAESAGGAEGGAATVDGEGSLVTDGNESQAGFATGTVEGGASIVDSSVEGEGSMVSNHSGAPSPSGGKVGPLAIGDRGTSNSSSSKPPGSPSTRRATSKSGGSPRTGEKGAGGAGKAGTDVEKGLYGGLSDDDRLTRLRTLYGENLDDDGPLAAQFVMVKRIHEAEEAAGNAQPGPFQPGRNKFRFLRGSPYIVQLGASGAASSASPAAMGGAGGGGGGGQDNDGSGSPSATGRGGGRSPSPLQRAQTVSGGLGGNAAGGQGGSGTAGAGAGGAGLITFSGQVNSSILPQPNVTTTGIDPAVYQPNDVEWAFGLAATFFTAPERWRRLVGARKKAIANIPGGRTIRAQAIMWDYYAAADSIVTSLATDLAVDVAEAKLCLTLHEQEQALMASKHEAMVAASARNPNGLPGGGIPGLGAAGLAGAAGGGGIPPTGGRRNSLSGAPGSMALATVPPGSALRTVTDAQVNQAKEVIKKMTSMYRAPVSPHLFFDWVVSHPIPRYVLRQLAFPMGRIATYDGLDQDVPAADARHKNKTANPTASLSKGEQTRLLSRLISLTGLTIHDLRPLRTSYIQTVGNFGMSFDQFRRFVGDFIANVGQIRKEEGMMFSLAKAKREEALAAGLIPGGPGWPEGMPIELPPSPPPPPAFVNMPEAQRRKLLLKLFSCFDVNGDNSVDMAEFSVGVSRVMHGSAVDKLTLIFDVYDADGDGSVNGQELTNIMLRALKLAEANSEDDEPEKDEVMRKQEDMAFAAELAEALDINGDGDISREEFFTVLRDEPLMYECFATSLGLPIGGLDDEEGMDIATAAKTGPIFDFKMLRLIRDRYSIDITKNRGPAHEEVKKPKAGQETSGRERSDSRDSNDSFSGVDARPSTAARSDKGGDGKEEDDDDEAMEEKDEDDEDGGKAAAKEKDNGKTSILERAVDRHHFRRLLRDLWKCPESALFLSDRIFEFLDEDGSGSMDVKELYQGITGALRGNIEERANFFYSLFDTEGLGHMKSDQIMRMLMATAGTEDVTEEDARAVLEKIDADGSGTVELEEFMDAVQEDPGIIDALSRIFGRQGASASSMFAGGGKGGEDDLDPDDLDGTGSSASGKDDHHHHDGHHGKDKDGDGHHHRTESDLTHAADRSAEDSAATFKEEAMNSVQAGTNTKGARIFVRQGTVVLAGPPSPSAATTAAALAGTLGASGSLEKLSPDKTVAPAIGVVANRRQMTLTRRSTIGGGSPSPSRSVSPAKRDGGLNGLVSAEGSLVHDHAGSGQLSPSLSPHRRQLGSIASVSSLAASPARRLGGSPSPHIGETGSVIQVEGSRVAGTADHESKDDDHSAPDSHQLGLEASGGSLAGLLGAVGRASSTASAADPYDAGSASARFSQHASLTSLVQGMHKDIVSKHGKQASMTTSNTFKKLLGASAAALPANGLLAGLLANQQPPAVGGVVMMSPNSANASVAMTPSIAVTSLAGGNASELAAHGGAPLPLLAGGLEALSPAVGAIMTGGMSRISLLPGGSNNNFDDDRFDDDGEQKRDSAPSSPKASGAGESGRSPKGGKKPRGSASLVPPLSLAIAATSSPAPESSTARKGGKERGESKDGDPTNDEAEQHAAATAAIAAIGGGNAAAQLRESFSIVSRSKAAITKLSGIIGNMERIEEQLKTAREEREERESDPLTDGGPDPLLVMLRAQLAADKEKALNAAIAAKEAARVSARQKAAEGLASSPRGGFSPDLKGSVSASHAAAAASPRAAANTARSITGYVNKPRTALAGESSITSPGGSGGFGAAAAIHQAARLDMRMAAAGSVASGVSGLDSSAFGSSSASSTANSPPRAAPGKGGAGPSSAKKTPGKGAAAASPAGDKAKKSKFVNEGEMGPARWYKDDPDVRTLLKSAMEAAKSMESTHERMLNEKNVMAAGEKEVLHHLQAMVIKKKLREIAERRAQLARMLTDAQTGKGGGGTMAALAAGNGGFVQGSKLRVAEDDELPLSVANALSATKKYETAVSSLKQDLEEDVGGHGGGFSAAAMDATAAAADALPEGAQLPLPPHTFTTGGSQRSLPLGIRSPLSATLSAAGGAVGALAGGNNRGNGNGPASPGSPTAGPASGIVDLRSVAAQEAWQRNILRDLAEAEAQAQMHQHHAQMQQAEAAAAYHELNSFGLGEQQGMMGMGMAEQHHEDGEQHQYYQQQQQYGNQHPQPSSSMFQQQAQMGAGHHSPSQHHHSAQAAVYAHALQGIQQHRSISPGAGLTDPSAVRFPVTASAVGQTMSPVLSALGVRPSALRSPGLKYPVPGGGSAAITSPSAGASGGRTLQHPASPLGFSPSAANTVGSVSSPSGAAMQSPSKGGFAKPAAAVRPSPASKAAGQMLLMASPSR